MVGPHRTRHNLRPPTRGRYRITEAIAVLLDAHLGMVCLEVGDATGLCSVGRVTVLVSTPEYADVRIRCSTLERSAERVV